MRLLQERSQFTPRRLQELQHAMDRGEPIDGDPALLQSYLQAKFQREGFQAELAQHAGRLANSIRPASIRRPEDTAPRPRTQIKADVDHWTSEERKRLAAYRSTMGTTYVPGQDGTYVPQQTNDVRSLLAQIASLVESHGDPCKCKRTRRLKPSSKSACRCA